MKSIHYPRPVRVTARSTSGPRRRPLRARPRRRGFTLVQILVVMGIIAVLAAILLPSLGRGREAAHRAQCDVHLKDITLALDAYRQENGHFPAQLEELTTKKYLPDQSILRCPSDPRPQNATPLSSYADFYVIRAPRDSAELPILVCPYHEDDSHGGQAYVGRYTTQFAARPATLEGANNATVKHPRDQNAVAATAGMVLHGGDRIATGPMGAATIRFQDGSTAALRGGSDVTILQSFIEGHATGAPLYSLLREWSGDVQYTVHHGSNFDVATPTATAGARGTQFEIKVNGATTNLVVTQGTVSVSGIQNTVLATVGSTVSTSLLDGLLHLL